MSRSWNNQGPRTGHTRRLTVLLGTLVIAAIVGAGPADAASYRYWSYWWVQDGTWIFASAGPASSMPTDGAVEGWRFGITPESGGEPPDVEPPTAFDQACGSTPTEPGHKRVALAIDPGATEDAPHGEAPGSASLTCVLIEEDANGYRVLRSVGSVRTEDGLICGITGYPSVGCAEVVESTMADPDEAEARPPVSSDPTATDTGHDESTGAQAIPLVIGGLVIGGLAGFAWRRRRRP